MKEKKIKGLSIIAVISILAIVFASICGITTAVGAGSSQTYPSGFSYSENEFVPNQVIVSFKEEVPIEKQDGVIKDYGGDILKRSEALNSVLVKIEDEQAFVDEIIKEDKVKYAERNAIFHLLTHTPNDPLWGDQWGPRKIKCPEAWQKEIGSLDVLIAIVDTGIDYNHDDLTHYVAGGYDWVNDDNDPMDDHGHGTHCAGIAAATMDNQIGIAGVAQVGVMAEKVCNQEGLCPIFAVAQGITHATDNGADVISMSFGGYFPVTAIEDACDYAWGEGVVLAGVAGNANWRLIAYPAKYDTVICVGSIDPAQSRSWFSNYGPEMELVAPGEGILSTFPGNYYAWWSGTSMSTPHVAGATALVISHFPSWTNLEVRTRLQETAEDLGPPGWDEEYGYGVVNAGCALENPWAEINEELDELIEKVDAATMPNIIKHRLIDKLVYAKELKDNAKEECEAGNFDIATKKLGVAKNQVESFERMVRITRRISPADKASFLAESAKIIEKIDELIEYIETKHKC